MEQPALSIFILKEAEPSEISVNVSSFHSVRKGNNSVPQTLCNFVLQHGMMHKICKVKYTKKCLRLLSIPVPNRREYRMIQCHIKLETGKP